MYRELINLDFPEPAPPCTITKGGEGFDDSNLNLSENVAEEEGFDKIIDGVWKCRSIENGEEELWKCWLAENVEAEVGTELVMGIEWVTSLLA